MLEELVLVCGDFYIPQRADDMPQKFKDLLSVSKLQYVLCTGNVGDTETANYLKELSGQYIQTKGDWDESGIESKVIEYRGWKIGMVHGHQIIPWGDVEALGQFCESLNCDILIYGHSHENTIDKYNDKYLINPGSFTGAYSTLASEVNPCFSLLTFQGDEITVYAYELSDELIVTKTIINKSK